MSRQRSNRRRRERRESLARSAQAFLIREIESNDREKAGIAAKHLIDTSRRNRLKVPTLMRRKICKNCTTLLLPGVNQRIRIRAGMIIRTCLDCGRVHRIGGGPKYHRRSSNGDS